MARDKKIHNILTTRGIGTQNENGIALIKNMINKDGASVKRNGHQNVCYVTDKDLNGLRINGIFDFSYTENQTPVSKKIIHAGRKLFKADTDFKNLAEITLPSEISLKDERTQALSVKDTLWLVGGNGVLIYDGSTIKSVYEHENVYIPNTKIIDDEGKRQESDNILTRKRINTFLGTTHFRDSGSTNVFLLDEKIDPTKEFIVEIKIRTRTSEEAEDSTTSMYIGVDSLGTEVGRIVTLRFKREKITEGLHYFLAEPIRDEGGNVINIKKNDEILTFDKMAFGMKVKNGREISLALDLPAPIRGEDNITVKYIAEPNGEKELIESAQIATLANGEKGKEIMLLNFGDNKIYFTDEKRGFFYLPRKNAISLGSEGEKITAIVKLSDNLVGVFKKNSFYRIRFLSSNTDGYEIISSTDSVGAYSGFSTALVDYSCLAFNREGVFGVSDKSTSNIFNCLRLRSSKINKWLEGHTQSEKENAQAISYKSRYYLFIGDNVYIADTRRKYREDGLESDAYEYEWWIWDNCTARVLHSDGKDLYFGTENGQIRKFTEGFCDIEKRELSNEASSLLLNNEKPYTEFIIPKIEEINFDISAAHLKKHKRLVSKGAIFENGLLYITPSEMLFSDGSIRLYEGDSLAMYDKGGNLALETTADEIDLVLKSILPSSTNGLADGDTYDIYQSIEDGCDYEIIRGEAGAILLWNKEKIKIASEPVSLDIYEKSPIECVYKTVPNSFDTVNLKTLYNLFLKLTDNTRGEVEIALETEKQTLKKTIFIGEPFSFDGFDFYDSSFKAPFKSTQLVGSFLRNFENLTIEIRSKGTQSFGLEGISLLYLKSQKPKRIQ